MNLTTRESASQVDDSISAYAIEVLFNNSDDETLRRTGLITDIVYDIKRLVVLGSPGIGKSTTLQFLTHEIAVQANYLPVYIQLKDYNIDKSIEELIKDVTRFSNSSLEKLLKEGNVWVLLDGLNEVLSKDLSSTLRLHIRSFLKNYNNCGVIISSRPQAYNNEFDTLPTFELLNLQETQIRELIYKYLPEVDHADKLWGELQKNERLLKLAGNPLMLTIIISIAQRVGGTIPDNRGRLLRVFVDSLLKRELAKNPKLDHNSSILFLNALAFSTRTKQMVGFTRGFTIKQFSDLSSLIGITNISSFVDDMIDLGLLDETYSSISFAHEMFQEYFSAEEILSKWQSNELNISLLVQDNFNLWEEPLIILSGILTDPSKLILEVLDTSTLLAAKCIASSDAEKFGVKKLVHSKALQDAKNNKDIEVSVNGFLALVELGAYDDVASILSSFSSIKEANAYRTVLELTFQNIPSIGIHEIIKTIILINPVFFIGPVLNALEARSLSNNFFVENLNNSLNLFHQLRQYRIKENGGESRVKVKHLIRFIIFFKIKPDSFDKETFKYISEEIKKGNFDFAKSLIAYFNLEEQFTKDSLFNILIENGRNINPVTLYKYFILEGDVNIIQRSIQLNNISVDVAALFALSKLISHEQLREHVKLSSAFKVLPAKRILSYLINGNDEKRIRALHEALKKASEIKDILRRVGSTYNCKINSISDEECTLQVFGLSIKGRMKLENSPDHLRTGEITKSKLRKRFDAVLLEYNTAKSVGYFSARAVPLANMIATGNLTLCKICGVDHEHIEVEIDGTIEKAFIPFNQVPYKLLERIKLTNNFDNFSKLRANPYALKSDGRLLLSIKKGFDNKKITKEEFNGSIKEEQDTFTKFNKRRSIPYKDESDLAIKLSNALANKK